MGIELLYHDFNTTSDVSPFNDTLEQISDAESLLIACPYISLGVLQDLLKTADSWRLITDVQELTRTQPAEKREAIVEFIRAHSDVIHDCRNLHAKLLVGDSDAFLGSANLTDAGLNRNAELGVHFQDTDEIAELRTWFDELWSETETTDISQLKTYTEETDGISATRSTASLSNTGPSINTTLSFSGRSTDTAGDTNHDRLIDALENAPSRAWINTYFNWVSKLIEFTDLDESDDRISTTVPESTRTKVAVNVNERYAITAYPAQNRVGMMLPGDSIAVDELDEYIGDFGQFSTASEPDPYWFEFPGTPDEFVSEEIEADWKRAVLEERDRGSRSSHRDSHNPAVYRAAVDHRYRQRVLDDALSD